MRVAFIGSSDGSEPRTAKTCRSLRALGHDVTYVGWDRSPTEKKNIDLPGVHMDCLEYATPHGRATARGLVRHYGHIVKALARLRPDVVHCQNEDHTFLLLPFRGILYRSVICDIFDALTDRYFNLAGWRARSARAVSSIGRTGADRIIATDEVRLGRLAPMHRRKAIVVMNVPEDPGPELAATIPTGPPRVFVGGSLSRSRGLERILAVAERLPELEIISVGWPRDNYATEVFLPHPNVHYHGVVTTKESLQMQAGCDALLALYEPAQANNIFASPNKVYDAMSVGRPVIINTEARLSDWIVQQDVGCVCPYDDVETLTQIVASLRSRRAQLAEYAQRVRDLYLREFTWARMEERLDRLYTDLDGRRRAPAARRTS
jgi:glycosyltransferase involved in cell wall biosynthesis